MKYGADVRYQTIVDPVMALLDCVKMAQITKPSVIKHMQYPMNKMNKHRKFEFGNTAELEPYQGCCDNI